MFPRDPTVLLQVQATTEAVLHQAAEVTAQAHLAAAHAAAALTLQEVQAALIQEEAAEVHRAEAVVVRVLQEVDHLLRVAGK